MSDQAKSITGVRVHTFSKETCASVILSQTHLLQDIGGKKWHCNTLWYEIKVIFTRWLEKLCLERLILEWLGWFCWGVHFIRQPKQNILCVINWSRVIIEYLLYMQSLHVTHMQQSSLYPRALNSDWIIRYQTDVFWLVMANEQCANGAFVSSSKKSWRMMLELICLTLYCVLLRGCKC